MDFIFSDSKYLEPSSIDSVDIRLRLRVASGSYSVGSPSGYLINELGQSILNSSAGFGSIESIPSSTDINLVYLLGFPTYDFAFHGVFFDITLPNEPSSIISASLNFNPDEEHLVVGANPIPEPATLLLLSSGLVGLGLFRKKFRKR